MFFISNNFDKKSRKNGVFKPTLKTPWLAAIARTAVVITSKDYDPFRGHVYTYCPLVKVRGVAEPRETWRHSIHRWAGSRRNLQYGRRRFLETFIGHCSTLQTRPTFSDWPINDRLDREPRERGIYASYIYKCVQKCILHVHTYTWTHKYVQAKIISYGRFHVKSPMNPTSKTLSILAQKNHIENNDNLQYHEDLSLER